MGRNKFIEQTGLEKLIEERGLGKYRDTIQQSVESLHAVMQGGEEEASMSYFQIIENFPDEFVGDGIEEMRSYISKDVERKNSRNQSGNGWKYDVGKASFDIASCSRSMKGMPKKASMMSLNAVIEIFDEKCWGQDILAKCMSNSIRFVPDDELEDAAKEIHGFFEKHAYDDSDAFSKAYGKAYTLPLSIRKDALSDVRKLSENAGDSLKLAEAYCTLAKALPEEMLIEKTAKIRKVAEILGADKALSRADQIAIEYVENATK
ncbi:MAG: hypothetical protein HZB68_01440 [Candidatus Aenigmarchaeota archaeon]|nr:hypothetical protein [Candidatus Aenigmarchaeota archaeon]